MPARCRLSAPAYPPTDAARLASACELAAGVAARLGWSLHRSDSLERCAPRGCRLPVATRLADLQASDGSDWLWALRGGYGCAELLTGLAAWQPEHPPRLLGYSDLTVLHGYWQRRGWPPGIYGLMPAAAFGQRAVDTLQACLAGSDLAWDGAQLPQVTALRPGRAHGPLFAACLRVLCSCLGGPAMPDLRGRILAIEDIDEAPYAIDRDLRQLATAGALDGLAGLVAGSFPWADERPWGGDDATTVIANWAAELGLPAIAGLPFGHLDDPLSLPQEAPCELVVERDAWRLLLRPSFH